MNTSGARLLQLTWLMVGLVVVLAMLVAVAVLTLLSWAGLHDGQQLIAPFRWAADNHLA